MVDRSLKAFMSSSESLPKRRRGGSELTPLLHASAAPPIGIAATGSASEGLLPADCVAPFARPERFLRERVPLERRRCTAPITQRGSESDVVYFDPRGGAGDMGRGPKSE